MEDYNERQFYNLQRSSLSMKKRGLGSVVAIIILALIAIILVSIFLGAYLGNVKKNTSGDSSSCLGIDIGVTNCYIFDDRLNNYLPLGQQVTGYTILMDVERAPGGREIGGLRFVVKNIEGNENLFEPMNISALNFNANTDYKNFIEYSSVSAVVRGLEKEPQSVAVSAVVGESQTICEPVNAAIECVGFPYLY